MCKKAFEVRECWAGQEEKAVEITVKCACGYTIRQSYDVYDDELMECYKCGSKYKVEWPGIKVTRLAKEEKEDGASNRSRSTRQS